MRFNALADCRRHYALKKGDEAQITPLVECQTKSCQIYDEGASQKHFMYSLILFSLSFEDFEDRTIIAMIQ